MERTDVERARLARLITVLSEMPLAEVRWVSSEGLVLERKEGPWVIAIAGDAEGRDMLKRLVERWQPASYEVLLVGGEAESAGVPSVHVSPMGKVTNFGAGRLAEWALANGGRPEVVVRRVQAPGRLMQWLDSRDVLITPIIIGICVVMYGVQLALGTEENPERLLVLGPVPGTPFALLMPWLLLTYSWLHANPMHLIMNMLAIGSQGVFLESLLGRGRFIVLYILSAMGGGAAIALFGQGAVGASGASWGMLTALLVITWQGRLVSAGFRENLLPVFGRNVALNLFLSFIPGVSLSGHLGGGLTGAALVLLGVVTAGVQGTRTRPPGLPRWLAGLAIVCVLWAIVAELLAVVVGAALAELLAGG